MNKGSCNYSNLKNYNNVPAAGMMGTPALARGANADSVPAGKYLVPSWGGPSYSALQHGNAAPTCSGYFTIDSAYPGGNNCAASAFGVMQTKSCR